ncbi:MAG: AI-2E family transporter [Acetobacteraceae bacterium]|nr:AI-2E family transporter [Acetobacteraceae bacterium]
MTRPTPILAHRIAWAVLAFALLALGLWTLHEFMAALIWAAILAIALWPAYQRAHRAWPWSSSPGHHNILLPGLFTLGIALVFVLPIVLAGVQAGREARSVIAWFETARHDGLPVPDAIAQLPVVGGQAAQWWRENLSDPDAAADLLTRVKNPEYLTAGRHVGAAILHRVVIFGFCLLTVFFLFKDGDALAEQLRRASERAFGPVGERVGRQIIASIHGTVDGLVLVGLAVGALMYVVYLLVGVPHPTLFGAVTAIGAMIPFGAPLAFGLAALLALSQGSVIGAIVIVVAGIVITFVADHFFRPMLIGNATKLPFVWVLFGILGGVTTWGLLGLFLGPAIMAALILLWREWTETKE